MLLFVAISLTSGASGQKVKIRYDKTTDFSQFKTYSLQPPLAPSNRPLVYASVTGTIANELEAKGLRGTETDGDLTLIASGGFDFGMAPNPNLLSDSCKNCQAPLRDPVPLASSPTPPSGTSGKPALKGTLQLTFVERRNNKPVWSGTVVQKVDEEKKEKSLGQIAAAIKKLLTDFPPAKDK